MDRVYLKSMAKEQINGKIATLFLCSLIIFAASAITSLFPGVGGIISMIISPVLTFGIVLNCLNISRGGDADVKLMFDGFTADKFGKIWLTYFLVELYTALWSLLFIIPGIVKAYSYMFAPYILADNPELPPREAIEKSKQMTDGYKLDLFILSLSFIGWILLVALTAGIASIYVTPYMNTTMANAYNSLKGGSAEIYDDIPEDPFYSDIPEITEITDDVPEEPESVEEENIPPVDKDLLDTLSDDE